MVSEVGRNGFALFFFAASCVWVAACASLDAQPSVYVTLLIYLKQRKHTSDPGSLLPWIINPFSPILLCDFHFGHEKDPPPTLLTNPLSLDNVHHIQPLDIVCCNSNDFDAFVASILPHLLTSIILFTSRWHLPQVERSSATDAIKRHPKVAHWFAQNPVYPNDDRYTAFPYGILHENLEAYADSLLGSRDVVKSTHIEHLPISMTHSSRKRLARRRRSRRADSRSADEQAHLMSPPEYYAHMARARFLLSPRGDRYDTYRHWEAIGLGALPIANVDRRLYESLFEDDMVYAEDADFMLRVFNNETHLDATYHRPNPDRICSTLWAHKVLATQEKLRRS